MKIELNDKDRYLFERVSDVTGYSYLDYSDDGYIDIDFYKDALSDLWSKYFDLKESYDNYKEFVKDNYKQKTLEETYR